MINKGNLHWIYVGTIQTQHFAIHACNFRNNDEIIWNCNRQYFQFNASIVCALVEGNTWWFGLWAAWDFNLFAASVRLYPANWSRGTTPWMADLKVSVVDLCRAWTPPPEILRNRIRAPSVFTGGGDSFPLSSHLQSLSPFCLD